MLLVTFLKINPVLKIQKPFFQAKYLKNGPNDKVNYESYYSL
jgi:hypothetical protein